MARPRFTVVARGYDRAQVEAHCTRIEATLAGTAGTLAITAEEAVNPTFGIVLRGYDHHEVEAWVRARAALLAAAGAGASPGPSAAVQPPGQVPGALFLVVRMREGYDIGEVDAFVERIRDGARSLTADEVNQVQFTTVRLRAGYDMQAVDEYLDEVVGWLRTATPAPAAASVPVEPEEAPTTTEWRESLTDRYELLKLADQPAGERFPGVRLREGYDLGEVDAFVEHVRATLATTLTAAEVRAAEFTTVRLRLGYDMRAVDEWLAAVQGVARS
ncbi:DivIVA domain-containing protein [Jiangella sp. DSM 45060]|uniref:DivIVA domain-containing protein n=1 Tax=Jiangella sp. DSM 45060 TaxID=1798224 RepID=UPI00087BAE9B|nr:DivIVA domain-containing protein [Jiangella sp. DSM 45060]SDS90849.1 DivIVA domain-containing protein [Jiangella sp. DSM 45060]